MQTNDQTDDAENRAENAPPDAGGPYQTDGGAPATASRTIEDVWLLSDRQTVLLGAGLLVASGLLLGDFKVGQALIVGLLGLLAVGFTAASGARRGGRP